MQRIFRLLLVAAAIIIGGFWFVHWQKTRTLNSGDVHVREQPADKAKSETTETASADQPTSPQNSSNSAESSGNQSRQRPDIVATLPASERITRNPPSGLVAAGTGKFELYRQGDLTFRLNTETGEACVLFATEAQWRKALVYEHGCANH
jgi:hypothetical protein